MTKDDFVTRQHAAKREENVVSVIWLIVFFAALIGNIPLAKWMDHHRSAAWIQVLYGSLFFGFLIGNLVVLFWVTKRRARKFGILCPGCGKPLTQVAGQIAVATGNCGHCGAKLFD